MRIWSVHPKYLDTIGLVATWRETLLARNVLLGNTKGYKNHPQLIRFKACENPVAAIDVYLSAIFDEAKACGYSFDRTKFSQEPEYSITIPLNSWQLTYETEHLLAKFQKRSPDLFETFKDIKSFEAHPMFRIIDWGVEDWEIR